MKINDLAGGADRVTVSRTQVLKYIRPANRALRRFCEDTQGSILSVSIIWFLLLFLITGMATDYMRHETFRAEMQAALDRGLLAAADIEQTVDAETTVHDYFRSADWVGGNTVVPTVQVLEDTTRTRTITGRAEFEFETFFLRLIGIPTLRVVAQGTAEERRKDIEVSLVLDISGTMRWCENNSATCPDGNRIEQLIPAAQDFIDRVVTPDSRDYTTVNIVPYAGQVNAGPVLFSAVGGQRNYGVNDHSCIEIASADFLSTGLPGQGTYDQVPDFHWWPIDNSWMDWGWCPSDGVGITFMNNDASDLHDAIEALRHNLHDGTGTDNAMKWGLALLDPAANPVLSPHVPSQFSNRPALFDDDDTLKFIILMTDGQITGQQRPNDPAAPINSSVEILSQSGQPGYDAVDASTARLQFLALCDMARDNDVIVYTIAYMAPVGAQTDMRSCAHDPDTHYYNVAGLDINYAFQEIATTINKIKLVPQ